MRKLFSLFILMFINLSANAGVYSYGTYEEGQNVNGSRAFSVVMEWDISDETKNPCLTSSTGWSVIKCELNIRVKSGNIVNHGIEYLTSDCMIQVKTLGELGNCLAGSTYVKDYMIKNLILGQTTTFDYLLVNFGTASNPCVDVMYRTTTRGGGSDAWTTLPNQVCGLMPPPIGVCSTPDLIEFNHGIVTTDFSVSELVQSFNVECNMDLNAAISLTMLDNSSRLKLGDNLYSTLMINSKYANNTNEKHDLKIGSNNFEISSKLSKSGEIKSGDYSGQTIMILSME